MYLFYPLYSLLPPFPFLSATPIFKERALALINNLIQTSPSEKDTKVCVFKTTPSIYKIIFPLINKLHVCEIYYSQFTHGTGAYRPHTTIFTLTPFFNFFQQELFTNLESNNINAALTSVVYLERAPSPSLAHELYLYQCYALNRLDARRQYLYNPTDTVCYGMILFFFFAPSSAPFSE